MEKTTIAAIIIAVIIAVALIVIGLIYLIKYLNHKKKLQQEIVPLSLTPILVPSYIPAAPSTNLSPVLTTFIKPEIFTNSINTVCQLPTGPWTETCKLPSVQGTIMQAECLDNNNNYKTSRLDLSLCGAGNVENEDGILTCKEGTNLCSTNITTCTIPPSEPFYLSCSNIRNNGKILYGYCKDNENKDNATILDLSTCEQGSAIENVNGKLSCAHGTGFCY